MAENINIVYIGKDLSYWSKITKRFSEIYPDQEFHFSNLFQEEKEKIKAIRQELLELKPNIIYIDYVSNEPEMIRLASNIRRDSGTAHTIVIGLLDNIDSRRSLMISLASGIYINVVKSDEISSLIHHPMTAAFPSIAKDLDYALAVATFDADASTICPIQYIASSFIHIESKMELEVGSNISLETNLIIDPPLLSKYKVAKKFSSNLFTNSPFAYDLEYIHADDSLKLKAQKKIKELEIKLKDDPKDKNLKYDLAEAKSLLDNSDKEGEKIAKDRAEAISIFVETNIQYGLSPKPRVLVFDSELRLLAETKEHLDSLPFSCRLHSKYIEEEQCSIIKTSPGIIAIQLDSSQQENLEEAQAASKDADTINLIDLNTLKAIISKIKSSNISQPYILLFNYQGKMDEIANELGYESIIGSSSSLDFATIIAAAKFYQAKDGFKKTRNAGAPDNTKLKRYIFKKYDPRAVGQFSFSIKVKSISETDILFSSDTPISDFTALYIKYPTKMTITVMPPKASGRMIIERGSYYGVISGLGEVELAALRQFINQLFFLDKTAEKEKDKEEQKKIKDEFKAKQEEESAKADDKKDDDASI